MEWMKYNNVQTEMQPWQISYWRFTLRSTLHNLYQRFNDKIANYTIKLGRTGFMRNYDALKIYLDNLIPNPALQDKVLKTLKHLEEKKNYKVDCQEELVVEVTADLANFATECSLSTWLRLNQPLFGVLWFNIFTLSLYYIDHNAEEKFGDRYLSLLKMILSFLNLQLLRRTTRDLWIRSTTKKGQHISGIHKYQSYVIQQS